MGVHPSVATTELRCHPDMSNIFWTFYIYLSYKLSVPYHSLVHAEDVHWLGTGGMWYQNECHVHTPTLDDGLPSGRRLLVRPINVDPVLQI